MNKYIQDKVELEMSNAKHMFSHNVELIHSTVVRIDPAHIYLLDKIKQLQLQLNSVQADLFDLKNNHRNKKDKK
jgi:hypothetical protein